VLQNAATGLGTAAAGILAPDVAALIGSGTLGDVTAALNSGNIGNNGITAQQLQDLYGVSNVLTRKTIICRTASIQYCCSYNRRHYC